MKIEKYNYAGKVYNIEVEPNHEVKDDQYYINAENGVVVHNCHPRDNIALRWLAQEYDFGYDIFDTIMRAREQQAKNLAEFLVEQSVDNGNLPIVIHGKSYKPGVPYCIGSYSTLIGHYIKELGHSVSYVDPWADDTEEVVDAVNSPAVVLLAHNKQVTYDYTGDANSEDQEMYFELCAGSVIVDPWRTTKEKYNIKVIHYGNTRNTQ